MCGAKISAPLAPKIWLGALIQIAISTIFMLSFGFPKIMIAIFATLILVGTAFSMWAKTRVAVVRAPVTRQAVAHPTALSIINFTTALCALVFVSTALFGLVIFLNSWSTWHQYEGQPHHESDFVVNRVYYQRHRKGNPDIYASGTVEGNKEWMGLRPYVDPFPQNAGELDSQVPPGTSIHIYLYPQLKGRSRIVVYEQGPPDEAARRTAMDSLLYTPLGLAGLALLIYLLSRLRRLCYATEQLSMSAASSAS